jgi:hypothetical protein
LIITERHTILINIFRCDERETVFTYIWNLAIELIELEKTASFVRDPNYFLFDTKALSYEFLQFTCWE